jgi:metal-responsive CopG/Arc/MetJ family transcriptional regulator
MPPGCRLNDEKRITVRLSGADLAKLDQVRGSRSRSAAIRDLVRGATRNAEPPTHSEALVLLREQAEAGSATAAIRLEQATYAAQMLDDARRLTGGT